MSQFNLPPDIEEKVLFACDLWIHSGHNINTYQFVSNITNIFLKDAGQSDSLDNDDNIRSDQIHRHFIDSGSYPDLKTKTQLARKKNKAKANYQQWLSVVETPIKRRHPATGFCIFAAREFGLILEKTNRSRVTSVQRPRTINTNNDTRKVASAIYLMSMVGELYPPHVMVRNDEELPTDYQDCGSFKVASNQTGSASSQNWLNWLVNEFDPATQKYTEEGLRWRLLFVDSHRSPIKEEFFVECYRRGILCVAYPNTLDKIDPFSCGGIFCYIDQAYNFWLQSQWENSCGTNTLLVTRDDFLQVFAQIIAGPRQNGDWKAEIVQAWQKSRMFAFLLVEPDLDNQISTPQLMQVTESQTVAENAERKVERDSVIVFESQHHTSRPGNDMWDYESKEYESVLVEMDVDHIDNDIVDADMDGSSPQSRKRSFDQFSATPDTPRSHQRPRYESQQPSVQFYLPIRSLISPYRPQSIDVHPNKFEPPDLALSSSPTPVNGVHSHDPPDNPAPSQALSPREGIRQVYHHLAETLRISNNDTYSKKKLEMMGGLVDTLATMPYEQATGCRCHLESSGN